MTQMDACIFSSQGSRVGVAFWFGTGRSRSSARGDVCLVGLLGTEASRMSLLAADIAHSLEVVCLDAAVLGQMICLFVGAVFLAPAAGMS